jgi:hypothetical protein
MLHHATVLGRKATWLILALAVTLAAGAGWAFAITSSSPEVIHACAAKRNGSLRLATACNRHERAVSWNVRGIPGAPGGNGSDGINGLTGAQGPAGTGRAFGLVAADGTLTRAKNATVNHAGVGISCITPAPGIDPATAGVVATPDFATDSTLSDASNSDNSAHVEFHSNHAGCPSTSCRLTLLRSTTPTRA